MSYSTTESFTVTHARYIASKIGADMRLMMRYYGEPTEAEIEDFIVEITELLAADCLSTFEIGFKKGDVRVVSLLYRVRKDGTVDDSGAGEVYPYADTDGASRFSFVTYSETYDGMLSSEKAALNARIPVARTYATEPSDGEGYWVSDRGYAGGGVGAARQTFRPHG